MLLFWLIHLKVFAIFIVLFNDTPLVKISIKNNTLEVTTVFNPDTDLDRSNKQEVFSNIEETEMPSSFISNDIINNLFIKNLIIISYIRIHSRRHYCF